jgi:pyruvate/2-oxoglutarate dehydrogenase complex dihydrolipoamide dehydrogenase (E3) component
LPGRTNAREQTIEGSKMLVVAGRVSNTATSVELDARGYIRVNERLKSTALNAWANGTCTGSPKFYARVRRGFPDH